MSDINFVKAKQSRILELEKSFIEAMKAQKFADALRFARIVQEMEPAGKRFQEFIPLLEEKVANDEEAAASSDEDDDAEDAEGETAGDEGDDDEDDEDDDEDEESEEDDEDEGVDAEASVPTPGVGATAVVGNADIAAPDNITLNPKSLHLTKAERNKLRQSLKAGIIDILEKEIAAKLKSSDPLLA